MDLKQCEYIWFSLCEFRQLFRRSDIPLSGNIDNYSDQRNSCPVYTIAPIAVTL